MNDTFKKFSVLAGGSSYPTVNPELQQQFGQAIVQHIVSRLEEEANLALEQRQGHTWATLLTVIMEIQNRFGIESAQD